MRKAIKIAINTILYVIIAVLLIYVVLRATNKIGIYRVLTGSMEFKIHPGDYIIVKQANDFKEGDIITYQKDQYYITHRIIKIEGDKYTTKGDANNVADEAIPKSSIVGKYMYKSELVKIIITYRYILIGLFILLFIVSFILGDKDKKEKKKLKENNNIDNNNENIIDKVYDKVNDENNVTEDVVESKEDDIYNIDNKEELKEEIISDENNINEEEINNDINDEIINNDIVEDTNEVVNDESLENLNDIFKSDKTEDDIEKTNDIIDNIENDNIYNIEENDEIK